MTAVKALLILIGLFALLVVLVLLLLYRRKI